MKKSITQDMAYRQSLEICGEIGTSKPFLRKPLLSWVSNTSSFVLTHPGIMARWSAATGRTRNTFILFTLSFP